MLAARLDEGLVRRQHALVGFALNGLRRSHTRRQLVLFAQRQRQCSDTRDELALLHGIAVVQRNAQQSSRHGRDQDVAVMTAGLALVIDGDLHRARLHGASIDQDRLGQQEHEYCARDGGNGERREDAFPGNAHGCLTPGS